MVYQNIIQIYYVIVHPLNAKVMSTKGKTIKLIAVSWLLATLLSLPYICAHVYHITISSYLGTVSRKKIDEEEIFLKNKQKEIRLRTSMIRANNEVKNLNAITDVQKLELGVAQMSQGRDAKIGIKTWQICNDSFDDLDSYIFGWVQGQGRIRMCFFIFLFICMYIVPIFVIVYTCVRISIVMLFDVPQLQLNNTNRIKAEKNKRNVACMVAVVAIFFLVCWTPFYLVTLISQIQKVSFLKKSNYLFIMLLTHFSGFVNSSLNPFIYFVFSANFRKALRASLFGRCADRSEGDVKIVMRKCESTKTYA
ncbi:hypothetical protein HELRODRAFT_175644 [Helobdella robusta]|uniref:G-protein coupled receptors family 1 profile domain-containing protein n=1 Tax=Helobdella robusta TaxID=6412 RepID=T1F9G7_HELRO|nr:hypothetical protein HELRODRAFT_175644 [Helobdella robusta]ESO00663.1 hypothetical protein HELRODRAFT_175644 [Helobdella robusta]